MDRAQLFDTLSNLPPAAFERLLIAVNMPRMNRTGAAATIGEQVSALLAWAESPIGPGVEVIARHLTELNHFEFDAYLRSLVATYEKWWEYYTLTDAVGRVEQPAPEKPSIFDFGLMVQTVAKDKDDPGSAPRAEKREKTERLPVLEGIRKYADDHVLLVGRPGSGKSTALIRLLLEEATQTLQQSEGQVPVLVELRYWNTSIEGLIQGFLQRHGLTLDDATLSTLLGQGRFFLLVDGLNELPSESARTQLSAFRRNYPKVPVIFTTRDLGLGGDLGIAKKLEMQPLTEAQMKSFIRAYVPDQAEVMLRQLNDRLREFGQTPLLLWMLCEVFQQSSNLQMPTNLAEVFRAFTTMYEDSSVRKHEVALLKGDVRPLSDRRLWKEALKALAALMMQGETPVDFRVAIHRTEAERELGKLFAKEKFPVRDILDDLLKYHLLQNRTTDQLEFRHQLIQEYYAAGYLLNLLPELSDEELKGDYLNYLKWTEPIALMLALTNEESYALRVVKLATVNVDLMLGSRLAGEVNNNLQIQTIEWLNTLEIPTAIKVRCWAMSSSEAAIPSLLKAFRPLNSSYIKSSAANALGKIGSESAIPSLLKVLDSYSTDVCNSAAHALGKIGSESAVPGLLRALVKAFEEHSDDVCRSVADALIEIGSESAVPGLLRILNNSDSYSYLCAIVVMVSEEISSEMNVPQLVQTLKPSNLCLYKPTEEETLRSNSHDKSNIPNLLNALEDQSINIRSNAAKILVSLGSEVAISGLLKALEHSSIDVCTSAIWVLGHLNSELAIPGLLKALEHPSVRVCSNAVEFLGHIGSESTIPRLIKALEHRSMSVRHSAAIALGRLGSKVAIPYLTEILENGSLEARGKAVQALGCLHAKAVIPGLLRALKDKDSYIRSSAIEALGQIQDEVAIAELLVVLNTDQNFVVRNSAATALGKIGNESSIFGLLNALSDGEYRVCKVIAEALGNASNPIVINHLWQKYFEDPEAYYLELAIFTIQNRCKFYNHDIFQGIFPMAKLYPFTPPMPNTNSM